MEKKFTLEQLNTIAEIEVVYRTKGRGVKVSERPLIGSSQDAYEILLHYWDSGKIELLEEFKVLLLNRANRVLYLYRVSSGGLTGTVADVRLILIAALKVAACAIILSHNHPSGNREPSDADRTVTQKIRQAAALLDIRVLDHVILTSETYFSFADEGLL
jgi:DNA repair protein RadC